MTIALTKYSTVDRPLSKEEVDDNWTVIEDALNEAYEGVLSVAAITLIDDDTGQFLRFLDDEGDTIGQVPFPSMLTDVGEWLTGVDYTTRHIVTHEGGTYLCRVPHDSDDFHTDLMSGFWALLGSNAATSIAFAPGDTGLNAMTMQEALEELADKLGSDLTAENVRFDNTASGLVGTSVDAALNELAARTTDISADAADIAVEPVGSITATDVQGALGQLDTRIDGIGTPDALDIDVESIWGMTSSNVQDALEELRDLISDIPGGGGSPDASDIAVTAISGITGTDVQAVLAELKGEIDAIEPGSGGGSLTAADIAYPGGAWSVSGDDVQEALVSIGSSLQTIDGTLAEFPALQVKLDLDIMDDYFTSTSLAGALNKLAEDVSGLGGGSVDASDVSITPGNIAAYYTDGGGVGGTVQGALNKLADTVAPLANNTLGSDKIKLELGNMAAYYSNYPTVDNVQGALNKIADTLSSIQTTLADHASRIAALETP